MAFRSSLGRALVPLLALLLASGCSSWKRVQSPISASALVDAGSASQMRIELTDARVITVHSPVIAGDTLRGMCASSSQSRSAVFTDDSPRDSCSFAIRDIRAAETRRANVVGTALLLGVPVVLALVILTSLAGD
jgi:hypothetical protein